MDASIVPPRATTDVQDDLLRGCTLCSRLHLRQSAQWLSVALATFEAPKENPYHDPRSRAVSLNVTAREKFTTSTPFATFKVPTVPPPINATPVETIDDQTVDQELDLLTDLAYNSASAAMLFENYREAAAIALPKRQSSSALRFVYYYARFLHTERVNSLDSTKTELDEINKAHFSRLHTGLCQEIEAQMEEFPRTRSHGPLSFLHGRLLRLQSRTEDAIRAFVNAVSCEPILVDAWMELAECMDNRADVLRYSSMCPDHWLRHLFLGRAFGKVGHIQRALDSYHILQNIGFAENPDVKSSIAKLVMSSDPDASLVLMESVRVFNPYRMNDVDSYSHLLFIMDDRVRMRILADEIFEAGRFTPECSIALGNFHSLLGDHEKAVQNFYKALKYNPDLHHVWTLIGHEHVELKQTELAMRSYSSAVEADPREYRAWYGLAQTLEILRAHSAALFYFKRAFEYCPNDVRMLLALADTFQMLENYHDAEMCYWRAHQVDADTIVLVRLAKMYEKLGRYGRAAELYVKYTADVQSEAEECADVRPADRDDAEDLGNAYLYLSKYYLLHRIFDKAFEEAKAAEAFREVKEEALALLKQITRMRAETDADDMEQKLTVFPARLGFPLWKDQAPAASSKPNTTAG